MLANELPKLVQALDQVIESSDLEKGEIHEVLLLGGSSHIPMV